jgi:hypothetical protein
MSGEAKSSLMTIVARRGDRPSVLSDRSGWASQRRSTDGTPFGDRTIRRGTPGRDRMGVASVGRRAPRDPASAELAFETDSLIHRVNSSESIGRVGLRERPRPARLDHAAGCGGRDAGVPGSLRDIRLGDTFAACRDRPRAGKHRAARDRAREYRCPSRAYAGSTNFLSVRVVRAGVFWYVLEEDRTPPDS